MSRHVVFLVLLVSSNGATGATQCSDILQYGIWAESAYSSSYSSNESFARDTCIRSERSGAFRVDKIGGNSSSAKSACDKLTSNKQITRAEFETIRKADEAIVEAWRGCREEHRGVTVWTSPTEDRARYYVKVAFDSPFRASARVSRELLIPSVTVSIVEGGGAGRCSLSDTDTKSGTVVIKKVEPGAAPTTLFCERKPTNAVSVSASSVYRSPAEVVLPAASYEPNFTANGIGAIQGSAWDPGRGCSGTKSLGDQPVAVDLHDYSGRSARISLFTIKNGKRTDVGVMHLAADKDGDTATFQNVMAVGDARRDGLWVQVDDLPMQRVLSVYRTRGCRHSGDQPRVRANIRLDTKRHS
jgi:hypothetical protein